MTLTTPPTTRPAFRPDRALSAVVALALALAVAIWGCDSTSPTAPGGVPPPPGPAPGITLASGQVTVPAARDRGDPGDHEAFRIVARLRPDLEPTAGQRLLVSLRDLDRPGLVCSSQEPEDGCVTVDWSADPSEIGAPPDGRFLNRLRVELVSGVRDYYLSRTLQLNDVPDRIDPNREHSAVGGLAVVWDAVLPTDLAANSDLELLVVLSKWQLPAVRIGFTVEVVDG